MTETGLDFFWIHFENALFIIVRLKLLTYVELLQRFCIVTYTINKCIDFSKILGQSNAYAWFMHNNFSLQYIYLISIHLPLRTKMLIENKCITLIILFYCWVQLLFIMKCKLRRVLRNVYDYSNEMQRDQHNLIINKYFTPWGNIWCSK